jgi:hypothetical protein
MATDSRSESAVPADILGTVLGLLPCLADRVGVRSVCRHWRAAARVQAALPAPLRVLVLPRFRFSCLTSDGLLTVARLALIPVEVSGDDQAGTSRKPVASASWCMPSLARWFVFRACSRGLAITIGWMNPEVLAPPPRF